MLEESARRHGQDLSRIMKQEYISSILKKHNLQNAEDMYAAIGYGGISSGQVLHKLIELNRKAEKVQSIQQSLEAAAETPAGSAGILPAKRMLPMAIPSSYPAIPIWQCALATAVIPCLGIPSWGM